MLKRSYDKCLDTVTIVYLTLLAGEPPPEVEFFKNGRPVDTRDSRVTISRTKETCKLQVTNAISGDSGKYTVTATNERGRTSHTVSVDVQGSERR